MGAARDPTQGKLGPNWEGPYRITSWQRKGTYHLETLEGQNCHTHGTPSTYESITSKRGNTKINLLYPQQISVLLLSFIVYFSYFIIYFSFATVYFLVLSSARF